MKTNKKEIIALEHDENALIFNAIGIKGYVVNDSDELLNKIEEFKDNIKIFIVSDYFKDQINELRKTLKEVYPIFLLLPLDGKGSDDGIKSLRRDVERATVITSEEHT